MPKVAHNIFFIVILMSVISVGLSGYFNPVSYIQTQTYIMLSYVDNFYIAVYLEKPLMTSNILLLQWLECFPVATTIFQIESYTYLPTWKQKHPN